MNTVVQATIDALEPLPTVDELDVEPPLDELRKAISSQKRGKAPSSYRIPSDLIKICKESPPGAST